MLDYVIIFSKNGPVLWHRTYCKLQGSPIDDLVRSVLLEERGGAEKTAELGPYTMKWAFAAGTGYDLVFVVCTFVFRTM
jgi:signal recognition particle receptor subunit alpha